MADTIVICVDGSDLSLQSAARGLSVLAPHEAVVVTVVEPVDLTVGAPVSGFAATALSTEELDEHREALLAEGRSIVERAVVELKLDGARTTVLEGSPGPVICGAAQELEARAIVMGSRGLGGFKRALLGSVSDHVVRNAPCPVVITSPDDD